MISLLMPPVATLSVRLDERAFAAATAELRPHVRAVVAAVLGVERTHPDVDDCAQEAVRRAIEGRDRLRDGEPLRPWVTGIARHVALDAIRARKRQRERAVPVRDGEDGASDPLDRVADSAPDAFERLADARRRDAVIQAMSAL